MTPEQREALATVLAHYGSDPRVRPLRELRDQDDATKQALFQAQEAAKELLQKLQRLEARQPMTQAQIDHLVIQFHRTRRFHGNGPKDIVRAVETFHGIRGA